MKRHLTEKELIEYQFELVSKIQAEDISSHLKDCVDCRQQAELLKQKFTSLDLLREDTIISDKLISQTTKLAETKPKPTIFLFKKPAWIAAAAAVLLIGSMLLISDLGKNKEQKTQIARKPDSPTGKFNFDEESKPGSDTPLDNKFTTENAAVPKAKTSLGSLANENIAKAEISDKPPFAPASAIELVTLPRRDDVQITIYNSADLTLVREKRNLTLKKGWNWLQFMWANTSIDPTSLSLQPLQDTDKIDIQQLVFPARLKDIGRWLIRSETEGQVPFEITYFTSGLSWRAFYMGTLSPDERKMQLKGYVRLTNKSGEDYENAQARLIVGKVNQLDKIAELSKRQYPYNMPGLKNNIITSSGNKRFNWDDDKEMDKTISLGYHYGGGVKIFNCTLPKPKEIKKEGLSEYFLYTIEGTETIPDKWGKRLMSFDIDNIDVNSLYKYDEERWGSQTIRFISFANDEDHDLGDTPIPNGNVRIYAQADADGHLSYVGGTNVKYIPVDEDVELNLGLARLVSIEPVLIDFKTANFLFDKYGNIAGWDEIRTWNIEITNTRNLPVEVEITRNFNTAYWTLDHNAKNVSYEKHDATHARFKTKLQPQTKRTFKYTITTYHGRRKEAVNK